MHFYKLLLIIVLFLLSKNAFADNLVTQDKFLEYHGQHIYVKEKKIKDRQHLPIVILLNSVSLPSVEAFDVPNYSFMENLANAGYDVWGFDFINQGQSAFSYKYPLTTDNAVDQLHFVLQHIRKENPQENVALLGWSWGTIVASKYAIQHPEDVNHLILYAAMYSSPMPEPQQKMFIVPIDNIPATQPIDWQMIQHHWNAMLPEPEKKQNKKAMKAISQAYCNIQPDANCTVTRLKEQMRVLIKSWSGKPDFDAKKITTPTLIIYGSGDFFTDTAFFNQLTRVNYKEQVVVKNASHWLLYEEKRTLLYQSVINFLGTHE